MYHVEIPDAAADEGQVLDLTGIVDSLFSPISTASAYNRGYPEILHHLHACIHMTPEDRRLPKTYRHLWELTPMDPVHFIVLDHFAGYWRRYIESSECKL